ncbi:unnamed protein product [Sphagnum jensenii]|uniref:RNA helicase n=1 Tax=Sphagnum jensenii TaxID=128206 RepID=A0ABP0W9R8_9BRYO
MMQLIGVEDNLLPQIHAELPVKTKSTEQRAPEPGEPQCVICGRYGEYICNETDDDICSLECKSILLAKRCPQGVHSAVIQNSKLKENSGCVQVPEIIHHNECILVKEKDSKLPEWERDDLIEKWPQTQVDALLDRLQISIKGEDPPRPILEFADCKFVPKIQENLEKEGYDLPTPVQMQAIPAALEGRDIMVSAETGSGKTAAFLFPIIMRCCMIRIWGLSEQQRPLAMVLAPTRELSAQVKEQAKAIAKGLPFKTALVVGGDAMPRQLYRIKQGVELIIGTPGRLIDLLSKHNVILQDVCMLALDEVDCMLERGFRDQVIQLVQALSSPQILMFSATIPPAIEQFSATILKNPLRISIGKASQPNGAVKQTVMWVQSKNKKQKLFDILQSKSHFQPPVVVFVNSRIGADLLAEAIHTFTGLEATSLHGKKTMQERRDTMKAFLAGKLPLIVATGIMGRGLDLVRVTQVIVFDMPSSIPEYIHEIGRASRLGNPGSAMVFINDDDKAIFKEFVALLQSTSTVIPRELSNSPFLHSSYAVAYSKHKRKRRKHEVDLSD